MSGRIITVFGASGFIGRHTIRALAKDGWRIRAAVRHPNLAEFLRPMGMVGQIQPFKADVTNAAEVAAAIKGADAVVNIAGTGGRIGGRFTRTIEDGARIVAEETAKAGARLVHLSGIGASASASSSYAKAKGAAESAVREACPQATILRPSIVFGPEDQFFNKLANLARYSFVMPAFGGGTAKFQPVFVGDVAAAVSAVVKSAPGGEYELGGPEVLSLKELTARILDVVQRRRLIAPVPFFAAKLAAWPMALLPNPPVTPDQIELMKADSVVSEGAKGLSDLGIRPESLGNILPTYLWRFRKTGQFEPALH